MRICRSKLLVVAILAASATAGAETCPTQPTSGTLQSIVQSFVDEIQPGHMFGVCAVVLDGKGHEGFACSGKASATQDFTKDTLFQIGSVTKPFTGTLFARRVREGVFGFGDRLDPHLPAQFRRQSEDPITLIQLATHHSGLPRDPSFWLGPDMDFLLLDACLDNNCLGPISQGVYSNWAFQILGYTIANVDGWGNDWFSDVRYNVLDMLGMTDTMPYQNWQDERRSYFDAHAAHGHDSSFADAGNTPDPHCPTADPSGCLYASPHDMRIWLQYWMHLTTPINPLALARDSMMRWHDFGAGSAPIAWDGAGSSSCDKLPHPANGYTVYTRYNKSGDVGVQRAFMAFLRDPNDPQGVSPLGIVILANSDVIGDKGLGTFGEELMSRIVLQQAP